MYSVTGWLVTCCLIVFWTSMMAPSKYLIGMLGILAGARGRVNAIVRHQVDPLLEQRNLHRHARSEAVAGRDVRRHGEVQLGVLPAAHAQRDRRGLAERQELADHPRDGVLVLAAGRPVPPVQDAVRRENAPAHLAPGRGPLRARRLELVVEPGEPRAVRLVRDDPSGEEI